MTGPVALVTADMGKGSGLADAKSVYLEAYLAPFKDWLERESVTEILVNRPGEIFFTSLRSCRTQHSPLWIKNP